MFTEMSRRPLPRIYLELQNINQPFSVIDRFHLRLEERENDETSKNKPISKANKNFSTSLKLSVERRCR